MVSIVRLFLFVMMSMVLPFQSSAQIPDASHLQVSLILEEETIQPGHPFWVAVQVKLEKGWHVYWKNPGEAGIPFKVEWKLPSGFQAGPLIWPFPEKFSMSDMVGFGYEGTVTFLTQIVPPLQLDFLTPANLTADVKWLVCSDFTCEPGATSVLLPISFSQAAPIKNGAIAQFFEDVRTKIPQSALVQIHQKHGILELEWTKSFLQSDETVEKVEFFPEEQHQIDLSIPPSFVQKSPSHFVIHLKETDEHKLRHAQLKGVLTFHTHKNGQSFVHSYEIDSLILGEIGNGQLSLLQLADVAPPVSIQESPSTSNFHFEGGLGLALLFAFLGGMLLNLMPCVLPVISLKVMSFVKMAGKDRSLTLKHGLMFSFGVILSFWVLASLMLLLRAYGQSVGWGFQLQEPLFVVVLASLLFVFSLSLFGIFEWGMLFASWAGQTQADATKNTSTYFGSFCSGVLATAVATPCTGPFLGSAVGFAITLPIYQALLIFTVLALGLCFPYLLLAAFPQYLRFLPKPGAWMETFKHMMGFLLLGTVLWLLWVFSGQTDTFALMCVLTGFLCFSIGAWIYGQGCSPVRSKKTRLLSFGFVVAFAILGSQVILFPKATWNAPSSSSHLALADDWEEFSPERVAQLRKEGKPVFIDFTAKWCLICQANHMILDSDGVKEHLKQSGVVKMKADWTKSDPRITEELSRFGRNSVPLYVFYGTEPNEDADILPQVLTPSVVIDHVNDKMNRSEIVLK